MEPDGILIMEDDGSDYNLEHGAEYITVAQLGSGWAAIHMTWCKDGTDSYYDVYQTGIDRYKTRAEAETEAKSWAESEEIKFVG